MPERNVGFLSLFIIIFSAVGSGPAGIEGVIGSAGVSIGLFSIIFFPFIWGFVQALISAELCIKYNNLNGAVGAWSKQIFGKVLARNASLWVVLMQCSTAAFVTEVTVTYIEAYWPGAIYASWQSIGLTALIIIASAIINRADLNFASAAMLIFSINAICAFAVLVGLSAKHVDLRRVDNPVTTAKSIKWGEFVNLLIYNSAGYDSAASIVSRVRDPARNMPRAMGLVGIAIAGLYFATLFITYLGARDDPSAWQSGHFVVVARNVGGEWLATWILISCCLTNLQIYVSALMTASYTLESLASIGGAPLLFSRSKGESVPDNAIFACAFVSLVFGCMPLLVNLSIESILVVFIMLTELACFLRDDEPHKSLFFANTIFRRRCVAVFPLILAMWVVVVQDQFVAFATLAIVVGVGLWSIPPLAAGEVAREEDGDDVQLQSSMRGEGEGAHLRRKASYGITL